MPATYSLDLSTLLTVPLHLALFSADRPVEELMGHGVTLLEALRRTAEPVAVFCAKGLPGEGAGGAPHAA